MQTTAGSLARGVACARLVPTPANLSLARRPTLPPARPALLGPTRSFKRPGATRAPPISPSTAPGAVDEAELLPLSVGGTEVYSLPDMWPILARTHGDNVALEDIHGTPPSRLTYRQMAASIKALAAGFWTLGVRSGDRVALFAEGSGRWLQADQALMRAGAISAVRGSGCPLDELAYIWKHSRAAYLVAQDAQALLSLAPMLPKGGGHEGLGSAPTAAVVLWGPAPGEEELRRAGWPVGSPVRAFEEVERAGQEALAGDDCAEESDSAYIPAPPLRLSSPATIVYTSGTTSLPRGVLLTQSNLLSQLRQIQSRIPLPGSHTFLSLLPPWHIYQRTVQYYLSLRHCRLVFSAVPKLREDLQAIKPDILVAVPLVLQALHARVAAALRAAPPLRRALAQALLAACLAHARARRVLRGLDARFAVSGPGVADLAKAYLVYTCTAPLRLLAQLLLLRKLRAALGVQSLVVCGGGALPAHLDDFYEAIGLVVLNGWGLTETSPVLAVRPAPALSIGTRSKNLLHPPPGPTRLLGPDMGVRGSVGPPLPETEILVVDPETLAPLRDGREGLILARGPGVMQGYLDDPEATAKAFPEVQNRRWLDTGDLGWRCPAHDAQGRPSLAAGCVVLTGRAKDTIVLSNGENVQPQGVEDALCRSPYVQFAVAVGQDHRALGALLVPDREQLAALARSQRRGPFSEKEVLDILRKEAREAGQGRSAWERVGAVAVLPRPLSVEEGTLTKTMKVRRAQVFQTFSRELNQLLKQLR